MGELSAQHLVSGAVAGIASRMVTAPIDLLKIRFQLHTGTRHQSIPQAIRAIWQAEGATAFWKGNTAGIWLYGTFSAVQFWTYGHVSPLVGAGPAGGTAALAATLCTYPFDLIRTRMALQARHPEIYGSLLRTARHILRTEGAAGFYKGIGPTLAQVIPYMGLTFSLQHALRRRLSKHAQSKGAIDFVAGGLAGVASKALIMPVDVVRKRLQIQGSPYKVYALPHLPVYTGLVDCVRTMWLREGVRGFYRGLSLAVLKSGPASATTFLVYGALSRINAPPG